MYELRVYELNEKIKIKWQNINFLSTTNVNQSQTLFSSINNFITMHVLLRTFFKAQINPDTNYSNAIPSLMSTFYKEWGNFSPNEILFQKQIVTELSKFKGRISKKDITKRPFTQLRYLRPNHLTN